MLKLLTAIAFAIFTPMAFAADGLGGILQDKLTLAFIVVNLSLTFYFAVFRFNRFAVQHGPEILTTIGIFGCFLGIALALSHFDPNKVTTSVPHLLAGVKTAFWASVSGVFGSLCIRLRHQQTKKPIPPSQGAPKAANLDDVVTALNELQKSLSGVQEHSLLSQMRLMRQEQRDQLITLRGSFDLFAKRMADDGAGRSGGDGMQDLQATMDRLLALQVEQREEVRQLKAAQSTQSAGPAGAR